MSFSSDCKTEISRTEPEKLCCTKAELYGIFLFSQVFSTESIRMNTESRPFGYHLNRLLERAFGFGFDIRIVPRKESSKLIYVINNKEKMKIISEEFGLTPGESSRRLNFAIIESDCCRNAFLKGAFLAAGTVTSPEKKYHLEMSTPFYHLSKSLMSLLLELELKPKEIMRRSNYVIYFKASEQIEEILMRIGAPVSAMNIMNMKAEKEVRNRVNRQVNCDTANLEKSYHAARKQIEFIQKIEKLKGLETLPKALQETAVLRLQHPEATVSELAQMHEKPIGKSGLNHRLRKLEELSESLNEKKDEDHA